MAKILVEESALDNIKRMAQQLQGERDAIIGAVVQYAGAADGKAKKAALDDLVLLALEMSREPEEIIEKQKQPA